MLTFFRIAGLLVLGLVLLTACVPGDVAPAGPPPTPTCTDGDLCVPSVERTPVAGGAIVRELRMREAQRSGEPHILLIEGDLRDGCTTLEAVEQRIDNNRVVVDLITYRQPDAICSQALVPFTYSIELEDRLWDQAGTGDRLTVEVGEQTLMVIRGDATPSPESPTREAAERETPVRPAPTREITGDLYVSTPPIDDVDIRISETRPAQVTVVIEGYFPDGCSRLGDVSQRVEGQRILVSVSMVRPKDAFCTQAIVPFTEEVKLDMSVLAPGTYVVDVNGMTRELVLEADMFTGSL